MTTTIITESGATRVLPDDLDPERVAGLDSEGRIVVDDFGALSGSGNWKTLPGDDKPFLFGLTLCCNASDKGTEYGVVCRGCYSDDDTGNYLYPDADGTFPGLDPTRR
jgi:hypothetical protein